MYILSSQNKLIIFYNTIQNYLINQGINFLKNFLTEFLKLSWLA